MNSLAILLVLAQLYGLSSSLAVSRQEKYSRILILPYCQCYECDGLQDGDEGVCDLNQGNGYKAKECDKNQK